jgi:1-aminocyclopropane-1-carboxylate deaminase/D-cysteine desulfhydrase-like pyridoxal-dependent ACC family enzyme
LPYAFVTGNADVDQGGNLRLLELLGATICELPPNRSVRAMAEEAQREFAARCEKDGLRGHFITFGGASLMGDLGYVLAAQELARQLDALGRRAKAIYVAVGTGGTAVGLAAGAAIFSPETEVVGYAVSPKGAQVFAGLSSVGAQIARLVAGLGEEGVAVGEPRFRFEHTQVGAGYAEPTEAADQAIRLLARSEGIFVDPVYTGKALAGLIAEVKAGRYGDDDDIVFVHTGGVPGLFFKRR